MQVSPDPGLISVVIPAFNAGAFLEQAVASILKQLPGDYRIEILICDDGSTDDTLTIARRLCLDNRMPARWLAHPDGANHGTGATRNLGLAEARGEYIALLDADDEWFAVKTLRQVEYLRQNSQVQCACSQGYFIDAAGRVIAGPHGTVLAGDYSRLLSPVQFQHPYTFDQLLHGDPVLNSSLLIRRSAIQNAGGYPRLMAHQAEDWLLLAKLSLDQPIHLLNEPLIRYRQHPGAYTARFLADDYAYGARLEFMFHLVHWMLSSERHRAAGERLFRREYPALLCARGGAYQLIEQYARYHAGDLKAPAAFEAHLAGLYAELHQLRAFARERDWVMQWMQRVPVLRRLYGRLRSPR